MPLPGLIGVDGRSLRLKIQRTAPWRQFCGPRWRAVQPTAAGIARQPTGLLGAVQATPQPGIVQPSAGSSGVTLLVLTVAAPPVTTPPLATIENATVGEAAPPVTAPPVAVRVTVSIGLASPPVAAPPPRYRYPRRPAFGPWYLRQSGRGSLGPSSCRSRIRSAAIGRSPVGASARSNILKTAGRC